ncbi:MAG: peptidase M15 [Proteobacteria bacterium SG_bin9]|nr:MAG: peptidase M15 [Proteobacteria bacterium SG_bin9]
MQFSFPGHRPLPLKRIAFAIALGFLTIGRIGPASAEAMLVVEADSGKVLYAENATYPWYQASVTKLMTAYVTLRAVKDNRLSLDSVFTVSPTAAAQAPSKMGFKAGTLVTVENALLMMMVKSANDMAAVLAEGVSGSIDNFSAEMNRNAQRLGMTQTNYVNPNGLPADGQVTSARDLAILARAIIRDIPEYDRFFNAPAIKFGRRVMRNYNSLIGRYPGADGMKTGFICASGFNLVASATRDGKRLIAVVLGAQSGPIRAVKAAQILERGFGGNGLSWLKPSLGNVEALAPIDAAPPNLRDDMCGPKRKRPGPESDDDNAVAAANSGNNDNLISMFAAGPAAVKPSQLLQPPGPVQAIVVYTGPKKTGAALVAAVAAEELRQTPKARKKKGGKPKPAVAVAARPDAGAKPVAAAKPADKPKPAAASNKPKPAAKPAAATATPAKPKPKPATSSDAKPSSAPRT